MAASSKIANLRKSFNFIPQHNLEWFPRHMARGMKEVQQRLKQVDCIIEVHDARIPFSGRNRQFRDSVLAARPHLLLLNKCDLADKRYTEDILRNLDTEDFTKVIFTNSTIPKDKGIMSILPHVLEVMTNSNRFHRSCAEDFNLLVIGVPNVGKSSVINRLRHHHMNMGVATKVGAMPGITKAVLEKIRINVDPPVYLFDSPGILSPHVENADVGMRLAVCSILQDHVVGNIPIADYLLYWFNQNEVDKYKQFYKLPQLTDNIYDVLIHIAAATGSVHKVKDPATAEEIMRPNLAVAASIFIKDFRDGKLGRVTLDMDKLL